MKSAEYVGAVVSAYRRVIDSLGSGEAGIRRAMDEARKILRNDFARAKTVFNFYGSSGENSREDSSEDPPAWLNPNQNGGTGIPLGRIIRVKGGERERRGLIPGGPVMPGLGDSLRFHKADDSNRLSHKIVFAEDEAAGERVDRWISIPEGFEPGDAVYLIQTKAMSRRYPPVIPHNLDAFRRLPGRDQAPPPARPEGDFAPGRSASRNRNRPSNKAGVQGRGHRTPEKDLPEGLYVEVSRVEDLYILQSLRPAAVMLNYSARTALRLAGPQPLPFKSEDTIIALDPFFPQSEDPGLTKHIPLLMSRGYRKFVINNPGHFSLFRGLRSETKGAAPPLLIAGPYLYGFNRWALAFLRENGAEYFISPLENNRQNLEKTFPREGSWPGFRSQAMITLFAWPPLFRVRANLGKIYDFGVFSDREGGSFRLAPSPETSLVYPETPFSLVDKLPFLREAGFGRFILDLSARPLRKAAYRDLMTAVNNASPLPEISRFNWKNGFYTTGD
jgi:putative protease